MKSFFTLALSAVFISSALAQHILIGSPADMTTVAAGSELVVEVDRPVRHFSNTWYKRSQHLQQDFLSSVNEIGLVIGISFCPNSPCFPPSEVIGTILAKTGDYNPQFQTGPPFDKPPYQNFTVSIPSFATGTAQLNIGHFSLVGVCAHDRHYISFRLIQGFSRLLESLSSTSSTRLSSLFDIQLVADTFSRETHLLTHL